MKKEYEILEIPENASLEEIKKAYKLLAKKYHPDVNNGNCDQFRLINESYKNLLSSYESKKIKESQINDTFKDMFKTMHRKTNLKQLSSIHISITEAILGVSKNKNISITLPCPKCNILTRQSCSNCFGIGTIIKTIPSLIEIPAGAYQNQIIIYKNFFENIDLYLKVIIDPDEKFSVKGKNILSVYKLNIFKALLGGNITISTIFGDKKINLPEKKYQDYSYNISGLGIDGGDHIILFHIYVPDILSPSDKNLLKKILNEQETE